MGSVICDAHEAGSGDRGEQGYGKHSVDFV